MNFPCSSCGSKTRISNRHYVGASPSVRCDYWGNHQHGDPVEIIRGGESAVGIAMRDAPPPPYYWKTSRVIPVGSSIPVQVPVHAHKSVAPVSVKPPVSVKVPMSVHAPVSTQAPINDQKFVGPVQYVKDTIDQMPPQCMSNDMASPFSPVVPPASEPMEMRSCDSFELPIPQKGISDSFCLSLDDGANAFPKEKEMERESKAEMKDEAKTDVGILDAKWWSYASEHYGWSYW